VEAYGQSLLRHIKLTTTAHGPVLSLPVGHPREAVLRPVATRKGDLNASDVLALTEWRNRFVTAFLTEFAATEERTANWLIEKVGPDDTRLLFMVDDLKGEPLGYMGIAFINWTTGEVEADAVVRGRDAVPGVMHRGLSVLLQWARQQLGLPRCGVRVRSDNPALEFYRRCGFAESHRVPLKRIVEPGMMRWVEDSELSLPGTSLVHMSLMNS
jgi:RimJ/RimL family protein N-acetyltransferase